jgi:hypothetical protein
MKKILGFSKEFGVSILSLGLPFLAMAQTGIPGPTAPTPASGVASAQISSIQGVLDTVCVVFSWLFYFLVALAVVFIVIAAFKYLFAGGDPEKVKGAGNMLLYAAVAVGVALLARAIPSIVASFLGAGTLQTC